MAALFFWWVLVNGWIGAIIGSRRGNMKFSLCMSLLLGPIGWLLAALDAGSRRVKCRKCAEMIKSDALVCRYCGNEVA